MRWSLPLLLTLLPSFATAGECVRVSPSLELEASIVVFRGTLVSIEQGPSSGPIAVFNVGWVWKGDVTKTFRMPATGHSWNIGGFFPGLLEIGNDLLVYAYDPAGNNYLLPPACSRTGLAMNNPDLHELGPGRAPE